MPRGRKKGSVNKDKDTNVVKEYEPIIHGVSAEEQETIIVFNKGEPMASVFTYEKTWQQHLEKRFGLKPIMENGFGGKEYIIDKKRIRKPVPKKKISEAQRKAVGDRFRKARENKVPNTP
jgi:hypothetical protein